MSRPVHIAALDEALEAALLRLDEAERALPEVLDRNLAAMDEVDVAVGARNDAFYDAQRVENAIRKLGFVVLDGKGTVLKDESRLKDRPFSTARDWDAARERAATSAHTAATDAAREDEDA